MLRQSLARGRATLGYLVTTPSTQIVQALARTGVDWLMIDMEHAPIGIESVAAMIAATGGTPVTPIVRVPAARAELVKPVLDCGALGVVFPQIATRREAEATVQAVRYAPEGQRGYGPTYAALRWGLPNLEYLKAANEAVLNVSSNIPTSARSSRRRRRRSSPTARSRSAASPSRPTTRAR